MSDIGREEIEARFALVEARAETRFAELTGKLDRIADSIDGLRNAMATVREDNKNTRRTIIGVFVGTILAAIAAFWTSQSNLLAAFQASLAVKELPAPPPAQTPQRH